MTLRPHCVYAMQKKERKQEVSFASAKLFYMGKEYIHISPHQSTASCDISDLKLRSEDGRSIPTIPLDQLIVECLSLTWSEVMLMIDIISWSLTHIQTSTNKTPQIQYECKIAILYQQISQDRKLGKHHFNFTLWSEARLNRGHFSVTQKYLTYLKSPDASVKLILNIHLSDEDQTLLYRSYNLMLELLNSDWLLSAVECKQTLVFIHSAVIMILLQCTHWQKTIELIRNIIILHFPAGCRVVLVASDVDTLL